MSIIFEKVPALERRVWLDSVDGKQLQKLTFYNCHAVDPITELLPYTQLEALEFRESYLKPFIKGTDCDGAFLPCLTNLKMIRTCLGKWSRLFDCHRPSLKILNFTCSHIGFPLASPFKWSDTPNLWPNLRELTLYNYELCTVSTLKSLVPHLERFMHLEKLILPEWITENDFNRHYTLDLCLLNSHPLPNVQIQMEDRDAIYVTFTCPINEPQHV